jgi:hypothetical protein
LYVPYSIITTVTSRKLRWARPLATIKDSRNRSESGGEASCNRTNWKNEKEVGNGIKRDIDEIACEDERKIN